LNDPNSGVTVAMDVSFVAFRQAEETLEVEIVVGQVLPIATDEQAGEKTRHHLAHVLSDWIVAG